MAQMDAVQTLEPALKDDQEFLELFKEGIGQRGFDNSFDEY